MLLFNQVLQLGNASWNGEGSWDPSGHEMWPRQKGHNWGSAQGKNLCGAPLISWANFGAGVKKNIHCSPQALFVTTSGRISAGIPWIFELIPRSLLQNSAKEIFFLSFIPLSLPLLCGVCTSPTPPPLFLPPLLFLLFIYLFIYFLNWWFQDKTTSKLLSPKGEGQTYQAKVADSMQMIKE